MVIEMINDHIVFEVILVEMIHDQRIFRPIDETMRLIYKNQLISFCEIRL